MPTRIDHDDARALEPAMPKPPMSAPSEAAWHRSGHSVEMLPAMVPGEAGRPRVDLAVPSAGLVMPDGDTMLGLDLGRDGEACDAWIRGRDVTACWETGDDRDLRVTATWRVHRSGGDLDPPPGVAVWELIASATSRRLHADATLTVTSAVAAREVLAAPLDAGGAGAFSSLGEPHQSLVVIRRGGGTSVAIVIHPADRQAAIVSTTAGRAMIRCPLFVSGVEKGVLLRSRVLAAEGPTDGDLRWAASLAERFAALPPELAT